MNLASLAALASKDSKAADEGPSPSKVVTLTKPDDSLLEATMDEFRGAADSKTALRSLRALLAHLK